MKIFESPQELSRWRKAHHGPMGFVPTMGALHQGHASLLKKSRAENAVSVLSIFVNPTQFNDKNDLEKYPRTLDRDLELASQCGVDVVFLPTFEAMYPDNYRYVVTERELSQMLCGAHRPGHFDGVLSVVMKLLNIVRPTRAYFGEKDYQQLRLIEGMVKAFFMDVEIVPVPTVREEDGLAMSSRNLRLSPELRQKAPLLHKTLRTAESSDKAKQILEANGFKVDYICDLEGRRFAAAFLGDVRLIDNLSLAEVEK
ncbi:MAG: pantoate--beta-alanine ligase [Bdellovibrionaceae bacterium]|nr:pantoate--beta-alanine ligase [Pseudobdellovibrionaceae bacterium]